MDNSKHEIKKEEAYVNITYNLVVNINLLVSSLSTYRFIYFLCVLEERRCYMYSNSIEHPLTNIPNLL